MADNVISTYLRTVIEGLVDNTEAVKIDVHGSERASVIELHVAREDLGKVIGKKGNTAKALRTLVNAASAKHRVRTVLEIVEPERNGQ